MRLFDELAELHEEWLWKKEAHRAASPRSCRQPVADLNYARLFAQLKTGMRACLDRLREAAP
jgi:hypothetical protein